MLQLQRLVWSITQKKRHLNFLGNTENFNVYIKSLDIRGLKKLSTSVLSPIFFAVGVRP